MNVRQLVNLFDEKYSGFDPIMHSFKRIWLDSLWLS